METKLVNLSLEDEEEGNPIPCEKVDSTKEED